MSTESLEAIFFNTSIEDGLVCFVHKVEKSEICSGDSFAPFLDKLYK